MPIFGNLLSTVFGEFVDLGNSNAFATCCHCAALNAHARGATKSCDFPICFGHFGFLHEMVWGNSQNFFGKIVGGVRHPVSLAGAWARGK